jgi:hypothetical protein
MIRWPVPYRRVLSEGGIGSVCAAERMRTDKRVALKCLDLSVGPAPAAAERLAHAAAARMQTMVLLTEYLEGEPVAAALGGGRTPVQRLIALLPLQADCATNSAANQIQIAHSIAAPELASPSSPALEQRTDVAPAAVSASTVATLPNAAHAERAATPPNPSLTSATMGSIDLRSPSSLTVACQRIGGSR